MGDVSREMYQYAKRGRALTGEDLDRMSDEELRDIVKSVYVFARTNPQHKYRIVQALQKDGI